MRHCFAIILLLTISCARSTPPNIFNDGGLENDSSNSTDSDLLYDDSGISNDDSGTNNDDSGTTNNDAEICDEYAPGESPIVVTSDCLELSTHHEPYAGGTALHMIGINSSSDTDEIGNVHINMYLDHQSILYLTAFSPTRWIIQNYGKGVIEKIIANGRGHEVLAPEDVPVLSEPYGRRDAYYWNNYNVQDMAFEVEEETGYNLTSFHGCQQATEFSLSEGCDGPVVSPYASCESPGEPLVEPDLSMVSESCKAIMEESHFCFAITRFGDQYLAILGLDTGDICHLFSIGRNFHSLSSIALYDQHLYVCNGRLARFNIVTGEVEVVDASCDAVTSYNGGLLVRPSWADPDNLFKMFFYPTFHDARCGNSELLEINERNTRFTTYDQVLYSAWHSTDRVDRKHLPDGNIMAPLELEGFDTWINGLSVISGVELVISTHIPENRIVFFDASNGSFIREFPVPQRIEGLQCMASQL